jgi:polygalacturonase
MRTSIRVLSISFLLTAAAFTAAAGISSYDITQFGARGDGKTMNTLAIQRAVDAAAAAGGGVVVVPSGRFVTGVITLKTGVELHLAMDAVLLGSERRSDYGGEKCSALFVAEGQQHIAITGGGTIDGRGREVVDDVFRMLKEGTLQDPDWQKENPWHQKRPNESNRPGIIHFIHCTDVRVDSVLIKDAACWVQTYTECERLALTNLRVESTAYWNNDGIDVVDCKDVRITGCVVNADDDGICLKSSNPASRCERVLIEHCEVRSSASAIKFGTASYGGFKDIIVRDIRVHDTYRSAVAIESVDGGAIENVTVENVTAVNTGNALFIRLGHRNQKLPPGSIRRVTVRNLTVEVPAGKPDKGYEMEGPELGYAHNPFPASIVGIPGHPIIDVVLDKVTIVYRGTEDKSLGRYGVDSLAFIPENESGYPEFSMFGELPAWGLFVRHAAGVVLHQVVLQHPEEGFRPGIVKYDAQMHLDGAREEVIK